MTIKDPGNDLQPGCRLGELEIGSIIGVGGMGQVFKARHLRLDRLVAVKVLPPECQADAELVERFHREMKAVGRIDHPNVVRAMDAREENGVYLLILEFVDGVNVFQLCQSHSGRIGYANACEIVRQTALGLAEIHRRGLIHRDIKPSNLQVTTTGTVKILDLGIALLHDWSGEVTLTRTAHIVGTLDYLAPEQAEDSHRIDHRADIYSLGCSFYFLLAGHAPYADAASAAAKLRAHSNRPLPAMPDSQRDVPGQVLAILQRMVAKNPDDRFSDASQICNALEQYSHSSDLRQLVCPGQIDPQKRYDLETVSNVRPAASTTKPASVTPVSRSIAKNAAKQNSLRRYAVPLIAGLAAIVFVGTFATLLRHRADQGPNLHLESSGPESSTSSLTAAAAALYAPILEELRRRNPGFNGAIRDCYVEDGLLSLDLSKYGKAVKDISPLSRMSLGGLNIDGTAVSDLSPLKNMPMWYLYCAETNIEDLSPLQHMPMQHLDISGTKVTSLEPLRGMNLRYFRCSYTPIADLSPLSGQSYDEIHIDQTNVADLSPLRGITVRVLNVQGTGISDLSPITTIKGLADLYLDYAPEHANVLRALRLLETINDQETSDFWANNTNK